MMYDYEDENMFNPCPNCGGEWYIGNAGAIRLEERWVHHA